jgi:hypothetical protein
VTRQRLRPAHAPERLAELYPKPHHSGGWADHELRVDATIQLARWMTVRGPQPRRGQSRSGADLSCGDARILLNLDVAERHLGDLAGGWQYTGPIEETIEQIPAVDVFVCTETLEHLDDPDLALKAIRGKTEQLILSTPVDAWDDENAEHYWAWSREDVEEMAAAAGFAPVVYASVDFRFEGLPYCFGIWGMR